jgi:hypothetical protein
MKRMWWLSVLLSMATLGAPLTADASWVSENCYTANHSTTAKTRTEARAFAYVADDEGYQWAGGCWNDNCSSDRVSAFAGGPSETVYRGWAASARFLFLSPPLGSILRGGDRECTPSRSNVSRSGSSPRGRTAVR